MTDFTYPSIESLEVCINVGQQCKGRLLKQMDERLKRIEEKLN